MTNPKPIIIGKIGAPYGLRGWVKLISYTDPPENIFNYLPWQLIKGNKKEQGFAIAGKRQQGNNFVIQPVNCEDREIAQTYTNTEIIIDRDQLPPLAPGEYYWTDLENLHVVNKEGQALGTVIEIFSTGANDVLVVEGKKRHLIPFLKDQVIITVDIEKKLITVDWDPEF